MASDTADRRARSRQAAELAGTLTRPTGEPNLSAIAARLGVSARTVARDLQAAPELEPVQVETLRTELVAEARQIVAAWRGRALGEGDQTPSATAARTMIEAIKLAASVGGVHKTDPATAAPPDFAVTVTYVAPDADHVARIEAARDVTPLADSEPS